MNVSHLMFVVTVLIVATTLAVVVAKKLNLGSIVALLVVGMLLGPHAPQPLLTGHVDEMRAVGEIGVMLLMFAIGLDIQPTRLWSMRRLVFGLGTAQYVLTTFAIMVFFLATPGIADVQWKSVLIASLALAMSSSAIPFPILEERGEQATPHGRAVVAIDILQGFMVIPVLALIPVLAASSAHGGGTFELGKAVEVVAAVAGVFVLGRFLLPWALTLTARNLGPGGFAAIVLAGVFSAGWWMEAIGISMALGGFMIGVLLSTTLYAEQVKAAVTPAKQWLLALFFIAIGMAIDLQQVAEFETDLLLYLPTLLVIKFVVLFILARAFGFGLRSAILTGSLMMPFDEIAYVITASANANGLLSARVYMVGIAVISFSFIVSPLLINLIYRLCERLTSSAPSGATPGPGVVTEGMVIVAGYGYVGRAICIILERAQIPYIAFELDPERLAKARKSNHNVQYGDVTNPTMMGAVAITRARLVIVTTGAYESTKRLIGNLRQFYPRVPAMTAVQYLPQRDELRQMGATEVVALTPEGTLSFARSVLDRLGTAIASSETIIGWARSSDYAAIRGVGEGKSDAAAESTP